MTAGLPSSRIAPPEDAPALRWGILGPGRIAEVFATSLTAHTHQRLTAVGSRSAAHGRAFAQRHRIPTVHGSYAGLLADPEVDIVYIATPNPFHAPLALQAVAAGKHALVEKPFAMDADSAKEVTAAAAERGVFVGEAMWPRFLPAFDVLRQLLAGGRIGSPRALLADLGEHFPADPTSRLFDPALGGGSLRDLGIYLLSFASFVLGTPEKIFAVGTDTDTGVDAQTGMLLQRSDGAQAHLFTTLEAHTPTSAFIVGSEATVDVAAPFYVPPQIMVTSSDATQHTVRLAQSRPEEGLCFEAAEAARMVAAGQIESPLMPHAETVSVLRTLDRVFAARSRT